METGMKVVIVFFVIILIVAGGVMFYLRSNNINPIGEFFKDNSKDIGEDFVSGIVNDSSDSGSDSGSSSDGNGEVSGGSGFLSNILGTDCIEEQIFYSLENIIKNSVCNTNVLGVCWDKTVNCSTEIHNYDSEVSGYFEVNLSFSKEGDDRTNAFDSETSRFSLGPGQTTIFRGSTHIESTGEDGLANKNISCFFNTLEVPMKEVCDDD